MRFARFWPIFVGLAFIMVFVTLERTPPARASFTLTGLVDCGRSSGATCSLDGTIVIVSKDSGTPTTYTIDLSWLKDLPKLDQDDQVTIEIEKLPDGTLKALNLVDSSNRDGTANQGVQGAKTTRSTTHDDNPPDCSLNLATASTTLISSVTTPVTISTTGTDTTSATFTTQPVVTETETATSTVNSTAVTTLVSTTTETSTSTAITTILGFMPARDGSPIMAKAIVEDGKPLCGDLVVTSTGTVTSSITSTDTSTATNTVTNTLTSTVPTTTQVTDTVTTTAVVTSTSLSITTVTTTTITTTTTEAPG